MSSVAISPATLTWTPQNVTFTPERVSIGAASLAWSGGTVMFGGGGTSLSVTTPTLDRIMRQERITEQDRASTRFQLIWQRHCEAIENAFEALTQQVADNTTVLAQIQAALLLAQTANDNATAVGDRTSLATSYVDPTSVLTASSDGIVLIAAHERVYGDGSRVSVNSGSASGFASGQNVTIYYQDAGREGGAVAYQGTINPIAQTGNTHIVGQALIPQAGQPTTSGSSPSAPGYTPPAGGGIREYEQ